MCWSIHLPVAARPQAGFSDNFTENEWSTIRSTPTSMSPIDNDAAIYKQFYKHWAAKEAYVKVTSLPLLDHLIAVDLCRPSGLGLGWN